MYSKVQLSSSTYKACFEVVGCILSSSFVRLDRVFVVGHEMNIHARVRWIQQQNS